VFYSAGMEDVACTLSFLLCAGSIGHEWSGSGACACARERVLGGWRRRVYTLHCRASFMRTGARCVNA